MATLKLFKSRAHTMGYSFPNGHTVHFVAGMYATANKYEIEELTKECEAGHPTFYIDPAETEVESEALDPMAGLKMKAIQDERESLAIATNPLRDMGSTEQGKLKGIANSRSIQGLQAATQVQAVAAQTVAVPTGTINVKK